MGLEHQRLAGLTERMCLDSEQLHDKRPKGGQSAAGGFRRIGGAVQGLGGGTRGGASDAGRAGAAAVLGPGTLSGAVVSPEAGQSGQGGHRG